MHVNVTHGTSTFVSSSDHNYNYKLLFVEGDQDRGHCSFKFVPSHVTFQTAHAQLHKHKLSPKRQTDRKRLRNWREDKKTNQNPTLSSPRVPIRPHR